MRLSQRPLTLKCSSNVVARFLTTLVVVLLVFWYLHKRGREVRLEKERELTEKEVAQLEKEYEEMQKEDLSSTTAPEGASIDEVRAGIEEVREARKAAAENPTPAEENANPSTLGTTVQPSEAIGSKT